MNNTFSFTGFTVRIDKIVVIKKAEASINAEKYPALELTLDGVATVFVAPYAKEDIRDEDYISIVHMINEEGSKE